MNGFKFKRQVPFGPYITDFVCVEARLIVEADGGQHAGQADADAVRTKYFEKGGYRVLRFWNNDVLQNLEGVLATIAGELATKTPSPQPSPQGEREPAAILSSRHGDDSGFLLPLGKDRMRGANPTPASWSSH